MPRSEPFSPASSLPTTGKDARTQVALRTAYFLQRRLPAVATCLPSREPVTLSTTASELKPRASARCFSVSAAAETACVPFWSAACQRPVADVQGSAAPRLDALSKLAISNPVKIVPASSNLGRRHTHWPASH